ncbi:MAG: hypothetical protein U1E29_05655 [Coriobacteriia bacterium]|nr:hypothetical protein [Coriobacteriia bacterium]
MTTRLGVSGIEAADSLVDVIDDINMFIMPPASAAADGRSFNRNQVPGEGCS